MPEEKDRIKSAFEIAMEKVEKLGSLSAEEQRKIKETDLMATVEAYAERCRKGIPAGHLKLELERFPAEDRALIKKHLLKRLAAMISLKDPATNPMIFEAIEDLSGERKNIDTVLGIIEQYQAAVTEARDKNLPRLSAAKRRDLELKGISGSAIEPSIENSAEWREIQSRLDSEFGSRLDQAKQAL